MHWPAHIISIHTIQHTSKASVRQNYNVASCQHDQLVVLQGIHQHSGVLLVGKQRTAQHQNFYERVHKWQGWAVAPLTLRAPWAHMWHSSAQHQGT